MPHPTPARSGKLMRGKDTEVLVVGAGPTGLVTAFALARQGIDVRVVGHEAGPVKESRATDVHARTLELLGTLGLAERLIERGHPSTAVSFRSGGNEIACIPFTALPSRHKMVLGIPQDETERLLIEAAGELGVWVEYGTTLVGLDVDRDHARARLRHPDGTETVAHARYVIGADGAHSGVRRVMGLSFDGSQYPEDFHVADVDVETALPRDRLHVFLSPQGFLHVLPLPGADRARLFADAPHVDGGGAPSLAELTELCRARADSPVIPRTMVWGSRFRIHRRAVRSYRVGRAFLAGDAAHIHSPVGGQGMNTGIQDAFDLGWRLGLVLRHGAPEALLDGYDRERRPVGHATLRDTHAATEMALVRAPLLAAVRDAASRVAMRFEAVAQHAAELTGELSLRLPLGPRIVDDMGSLLSTAVIDGDAELPTVADWVALRAAPAPGQRAPDAAFTDGTRVHDLGDGLRHVVLLFDGRRDTGDGHRRLAALADEITRRFARTARAVVVVPSSEPPQLLAGREVKTDASSSVHDAFGARGECVHVLRPDAVIGYRGQPLVPANVVAYLSSVLG